MKQFLLLCLLMVVLAIPLMAQYEVPPVASPDDSLPLPGTQLADHSNQLLTFHSSSSTVIIQDLVVSEPLSPRLRIGTVPTASVQASATLHLSTDGGTTFRQCTCPAGYVVVFPPAGTVFNPESIDVSIPEFSLSGGTLPGGVMVRESPSKASLGRMRLRESPTLPSRRCSFFDVFTEVSLDGGVTWTEADGALRLQLRQLRPPVLTTTTYPVSPGHYTADLDGDGSPDLVVSFGSSALPAPPVGSTQLYKLQSGFIYATAPQSSARAGKDDDCDISVTHTYDDQTGSHFDLELLSMPISGGTLPSGLMIRESPTLPSRGKTVAHDMGGGQFRISSFFDIFTEISLDGGATWNPQTPASLQFTDTLRSATGTVSGCVSGATYPNDLYPPPGALVMVRESPSLPSRYYPRGSGVRRLQLSPPAGGSATPRALPPPASSLLYNVDEDCDFQYDNGSGTGFADVHATGTASVQITRSADDGDTRTYDMEMLSLDLTGSSGGQLLRLRESPTKASLGHTTVRQNAGGYLISSFFDIWTEISDDGGATWSEAAESLHVTQTFFPDEHAFASDNFPPPGIYKGVPECAVTAFDNGAQLQRYSFFDIFTDRALPPMGGGGGASTAAYAATGRCAFSVSLDNGGSFFDVFSDVSLTLEVSPGDSTPDGNFYEVVLDSFKTSQPKGVNSPNLLLRESPSKASLGRIRLRESPTLSHLRSSFFDIFPEISLDGGNTWSASSTPMRIELDTITGSSIAGTVWHDVNGDGVRTGGENGLFGQKVILSDSLGNPVDSVLTNSGGAYSFTGVAGGTWHVDEILQPGWIVTAGLPGYGLMVAPNSSVAGLDFGNFQAPVLSGTVFNDHNQNGTPDSTEQGLAGWEVCASPAGGQNTDITGSNVTATYSLRLNGLPPGEPVIGSLTGSFSLYRARKRPEILYQAWDDGMIPVEVVNLDLSGRASGPDSGSTVSLTNTFVPTSSAVKIRHKGWDGCIYGNKREAGGLAPHLSSFDIDVDVVVTAREPQSGQASGRRMHGLVRVETMLDSTNTLPDPLLAGIVYRTAPGSVVVLTDDNGVQAGVLDSIVLTIGERVSPQQPACTTTGLDGSYAFAPLPPGSWSMSAHIKPPWSPTYPPPPPMNSVSGAQLPPVSFGFLDIKDTLKYRTFSVADWIAASGLKSIKKPKPGKPGNGMPNLVNAAEELFVKMGKGQSEVHVGVHGLMFADGKTEKPSVVPVSQKDVFTTFFSKRLAHSDGIHHGLDFFNGGLKMIVKLQKSLPASKQDNGCVAEMLALSCNLALSDNGLAQEGLGELIYASSGSPFDGKTVRQIAAYGDSLMTLWPFHTQADFDNLHAVAASINSAFSCGGPTFACTTPVPLDSTWWMGHPNLRIKGRFAVTDVPYLRSNPGATPYTIPVTAPIVEQPAQFSLNQNYPNPFNPTTMIAFDLGAPSIVTIRVYNILGQEVATLIDHESMDAGSQAIQFDTRSANGGLPSGVYFCRMVAEGISGDQESGVASSFTQVKKMMLLK
jgi:hypothetical protein